MSDFSVTASAGLRASWLHIRSALAETPKAPSCTRHLPPVRGGGAEAATGLGAGLDAGFGAGAAASVNGAGTGAAASVRALTRAGARARAGAGAGAGAAATVSALAVSAAAGDWVQSHTNGWLVPAGNTDALVRVAVELAQSPTLLAQAREQARARVAHLDWQQIALQVEALMLQAAGASPSLDSVLRPAMAQRSAPLL